MGPVDDREDCFGGASVLPVVSLSGDGLFSRDMPVRRDV